MTQNPQPPFAASTAESEHTLVGPLLAQLSGRFSAAELDQVRDAYEFAARWHEGQRRKSGDQYITHPLAVAEAAAAVHLDCTIVRAALLHDVLEDTDCEPENLRAEFGDEIAELADRLTAFRFGAAVPDDDRVITLTLLDRLHNTQISARELRQLIQTAQSRGGQRQKGWPSGSIITRHSFSLGCSSAWVAPSPMACSVAFSRSGTRKSR
jgi:(p)ppGpp synthase/HD superfamily hydrolase